MAMEWVVHQDNGFTMVELIITIVIIGILAGIVVFTPKTFLVTSRNQERVDDVASIARRLEQAYGSQDLGHPAYPSTAELAADIAGDTRTMTRIQPEALQAPGGSANSVVSATSTSTSDPAGANTPTIKQYVYQPLTAAGALCSANPSTASPCVRFFLYYRDEATSSVKSIKSMHQQ